MRERKNNAMRIERRIPVNVAQQIAVLVGRERERPRLTDRTSAGGER